MKLPRNSAKAPESGGFRALAHLAFGLVAGMAMLASPPRAAAEAPGATFSSGSRQITVIELFTSEGCSSCPPADRWFSELKHDPGLWREFVPLAFHVDYWDYIGWRDRFAAPENTARQREYARSGGVSTVYTPGFVANGKEWRGWFRRQPRPASAVIAGSLEARYSGGTIAIRFAPTGNHGAYLAHAALLGADLVSTVRAGENRGRELRHDFVVIDARHVPMNVDGDAHSGEIAFPPAPDAGPLPAALAVWVTRPGELAPLQATGGWLPGRP